MRLIGLTASTFLCVVLSACGSSEKESAAPPTAPPVTDPGPEDTSGDPTPDAGSAPKDAGKAPPDAGKPDAGPFVPWPHPSYPEVPKNQGQILKPMKLVTVIASGDPLAAGLFAASDAMIAGEWWKTVGADYGLGAAGKSVHVTGAAITKNLHGTEMQSYITKSITGKVDAQPDGNTMFLLYLPPGISDIDDQTNQVNTGCSLHGGYHTAYGNGGDGWGFGMRCPLVGQSELAGLTETGSHEVIEAATDPVPGRGYTLGQRDPNGNVWQMIAGGGEIGDLCVNETTFIDGNYFQRIWSNTAAKTQADPCVPASPRYFNTSPDTATADGWYPIGSGTTKIPLRGWSTVSVGDWTLIAGVATDVGNQAITVTVSGTSTKVINGQTYVMVNNGTMATLEVSANGAAAGAYALVYLVSRNLSGGGGEHVYPVGVFVQ